MRIDFMVVQHGVEHVFKHTLPVDQKNDGQRYILFNRLSPLPAFEDGTLSVYRNGAVFDETSLISLHSTAYSSGLAFKGLTKIYNEEALLCGKAEAAFNLDANEFKSFDVIKIETPNVGGRGYSFSEDLRKHFKFMRYAGETAGKAAPFDAPLPRVLRF